MGMEDLVEGATMPICWSLADEVEMLSTLASVDLVVIIVGCEGGGGTEQLELGVAVWKMQKQILFNGPHIFSFISMGIIFGWIFLERGGTAAGQIFVWKFMEIAT